MRIPVCASDLPDGFNKIAKYLGRHWPTQPVPFSQGRERLALIMGYSSAYALSGEAVAPESIADLPWSDMLQDAVGRAPDGWGLSSALLATLVEKLPWHEITAGDRARHRATQGAGGTVEEREIRLSCSPSKHWACARNGVMRYTKKQPANPIWRFVAVSADQRELRVKYWPVKPSAQEVSSALSSAIKSLGAADGVIVPRSFAQQYPGLAERTAAGLRARAPRDQVDAGVHFFRRAEAFVERLAWALEEISEEPASPDEISSISESGLLALLARKPHDIQARIGSDEADYRLAHSLAARICQLRGRDPAEGRRREERAPLGSAPNRRDRATPERDMVEHLLSGGALPELRKPFAFDDYDHQAFTGVARILAKIRQQGRTPELMGELGGLAVEYLHAPYVQRRYEQYGDGHGRRSFSLMFGRESAEVAIIGEAMARTVDQPFTHLDWKGAERLVSFHVIEAVCTAVAAQTKELRGLPRHPEVVEALRPAWQGATKIMLDPQPADLLNQFSGAREDVSALMFRALGRMEWSAGYGSYHGGNLTKASCVAKFQPLPPQTLSFYVAAQGRPGERLVQNKQALADGFLQAEQIVNPWLSKWETGLQLTFTRVLSPLQATAFLWKLPTEERRAYLRQERERAREASTA